MRLTGPTFVTQLLKKGKCIASPLYTNARNQKPNLLVEKVGVRLRRRRRTKEESRRRVTATRDDEMSKLLATEMNKRLIVGDQRTRAGIRPAVIPQRAAEQLIVTAVGLEEADERRTADMRKGRARAETRLMRMALTTMKEIDSRWRISCNE